MKKFFKSLMLISVCLGLSATVNAKTFRYATTGDILGLDPHANNEGPTNTMKGNIYGRMLHRKADLSLEPDLATKWEKLDANTWRFSLRRGVKSTPASGWTFAHTIAQDKVHKLNADYSLNRFSKGYLLDEKGLGTKTWIS